MDRVGGYDSLLALREDARAYEDVLIMLAGEADAQRVLALEAQVKARRGY